MKIKNLKGFTLLEVLVSLTFITIISSSIYLMASFLISSTESISKNYLRKLSYKSYLERLKINNEINTTNATSFNIYNGKKTNILLSYKVDKVEFSELIEPEPLP